MPGGNAHQRAMDKAARSRLVERVAEIVFEKIRGPAQLGNQTEPSKAIHWRDLLLPAFGLLLEALALLFGVAVLTLGAAALFWLSWRKYRIDHRPEESTKSRIIFGISTAVMLILVTTLVPIGISKVIERRSVGQAGGSQKFTADELQQIKDALGEVEKNSLPSGLLSEHPGTETLIPEISKPFSFALDVVLFSPTRNRTVMLYDARPGMNGTSLCPANLALYLRLQNLQTIASRISGWSLELAYGDKWEAPVVLDSRFGTMYAITGDPKRAARLATEDGFDSQLAARSYILKPGDPVEGWALFEYPKNAPYFGGDFKLSVEDTLGHKWSGIVPRPIPRRRNTNSLGGKLDFAAVEDVSSFAPTFCDN